MRSRSIELVQPGEGIPGRALDVRPIGPETLLDLGVQGLDKPLTARIDGSPAPAKGAEVSFRVNLDAVLIFANSESIGEFRQ